MTQPFLGKVAFVTGAGTGIGAMTAETLAARGAAVALLGRRLEPLEATAQRIERNGGRALVVTGDVGLPDDLAKAVSRTVDTFGALHLAVNNAGIAQDHTLIADIEIAEWDAMIRTNLSGVFYGLKVQIPAIAGSGGGAIVNISSVAGGRGVPGRAGYVAAKHALRGLTRTAAMECAKDKIRVNEVRAGMFDTQLASSNPEDSSLLLAATPLGRIGNVREAADAICYLLSDEASYISGACLDVDGGMLA